MAFLRRVAAEQHTECVLWPYGLASSGYGMVSWEDGTAPAHRVALILRTGHDPGPGFDACHAPPEVCGNRRCVNHAHLRWGSHAENMGELARWPRRTGVCVTEDEVAAILATRS